MKRASSLALVKYTSPFVAVALFLLLPSIAHGYASFGSKYDPIRGVNVGGWLVLERWITPSLFSGLPDNVTDEYTFSQTLGPVEASNRLKTHRDTWFNETDVIALKSAGVNHLRIPLGYWAFEIPTGEPYINGSWAYALKAIQWAKKYDMLVMLCLHGAPGSQNGQANSGRSGAVDFFYNDDNLKVATGIIGKMAQAISTPEYRDTVSIIEVLNEPRIFGNETTYNYRLDRLKQYYNMSYAAVRKYSDKAVVAFHDAFIAPGNWTYLADTKSYSLPMLDSHYYQVFNDKFKTYTCEQQVAYPCTYRDALAQTKAAKLMTVVGEWSLAFPITCTNQQDFARQQIGVYEMSNGWFFWAHKNGQGWRGWDFQASVKQGWINLYKKNTAVC